METLNELIEALESRQVTVVSGILMALSITGGLCGVPWLEGLLWGVIAISGTPVIYGALTALIKERRISFTLPVGMGIVASLIVGEQMAAAEIALIMAVGELLEHGTAHRARRGLERLLRLAPAQARRVEHGVEETVPLEDIGIGDTVRVLPGETIPVDGAIVAGGGGVNQALLTGEPLPLDKHEGDTVFAGSGNCNGCMDIRVTSAPQDSTLQRLIRLVEEAGSHQPRIQRGVDKLAQWLVPSSLLLAVAGFVTLRLAGFGTEESLLRAVTVLVTFCPCGLVLATPTCIMAAIGQASRHGVVVKRGTALESLSTVDTVCFDKTGTLTQGHPSVVDVHPFNVTARDTVLQLAASVESRSAHPLARAIAAAAQPLEVKGFRSYDGCGVRGGVDGKQILCGKEAFLEREGVELSGGQKQILEGFRTQGLTTVLVAADGKPLGVIALQDTLRPACGEVVHELGRMGLTTVLLTGDNLQAAHSITRSLELGDIHAGLLPEDKAWHIQRMTQAGHRVAMVGDGVNDAPALKLAHVGISMSHLGSDVATEAADISLMQDDLQRLPYLLRLAKATMGSIRFNIAMALGINAAAVLLGLLGVLTPLTGALVHNAGSFLVILNAAMLYNRRIAGLQSIA